MIFLIGALNCNALFKKINNCLREIFSLGIKERSEQEDKLSTFAKVGARPSENPQKLGAAG